MSRSVENILLQVNHVKHKKYEGTLYLMGERLAWMASHKNDTFAGMYFFLNPYISNFMIDHCLRALYVCTTLGC